MTEDRESYHGYSVDDEDQPQSGEDSLTDDGSAEPLDEGVSAPEGWSPGQGYGTTPREEALGETLEQRLEQEVPETDPYEAADRTPVDELDERPGASAEEAAVHVVEE